MAQTVGSIAEWALLDGINGVHADEDDDDVPLATEVLILVNLLVLLSVRLRGLTVVVIFFSNSRRNLLV